jgi:uncharacterized membrane protein
MRRLSAPWWGDLTAVLAFTVVGFVVALSPLEGPARAAVLLPLALILPGYALTCAFFLPGEIRLDLRLVLSVAFSVGVAAVGGLIVQLAIPLDRPVSATLLVLVTVVASLVALTRRDGMPADTEQPTLRIPRIGLVSLVGMLAAVGIGGWAIALATDGAHRQANEAHFSSLWLVPAEDPPTSSAVRVGVTNHEGRATIYDLSVRRAAGTVRRWQLSLEADHTWNAELAASAIPGTGPVIAQLNRDGRRDHRVVLRLGAPG